MKYTLFAIAFALSSTLAIARDSSSGCGPGWYILPDNSLVSSALRAVTNTITWPISTLGMTVGSSNCTQHKLVLKEKETLYFATQNYYELMRESALGGGEFMGAYFSTIGCHSGIEAHFSKLIQQNYNQIFHTKSDKPEDLVEETFKIILEDSELSQSCSLS
jgi:hypothetical protein